MHYKQPGKTLAHFQRSRFSNTCPKGNNSLYFQWLLLPIGSFIVPVPQAVQRVKKEQFAVRAAVRPCRVFKVVQIGQSFVRAAAERPFNRPFSTCWNFLEQIFLPKQCTCLTKVPTNVQTKNNGLTYFGVWTCLSPIISFCFSVS
ncbi:hypothetical protein POM88_023014 [Heracleum sosnowskyi]|uniref:Uncharacterized protein n=1 Tax=Heracleum sosnowskyi TaxID=360622 RepID=A0AAD8MU78_9APIA|nr:hypothetical protein POM88_023014 [Heracleum sosnowskyi]